MRERTGIEVTYDLNSEVVDFAFKMHLHTRLDLHTHPHKLKILRTDQPFSMYHFEARCCGLTWPWAAVTCLTLLLVVMLCDVPTSS